MADVRKLPQREEIAPALKWDLSRIYASQADFDADFSLVEGLATDFSQQAGQLKAQPAELLSILEAYLSLYRKLEKLYVYASMKNDQDTRQAEFQALSAKVQKLYAQVAEKTAWFQPELLAIPEKELATVIASDVKFKDYQRFLDQLTAQRAHVLSQDQEALLAGASDIFGAAENIFGTLNNADLNFGTVEDDQGNELELSNGVYGRLLESSNRQVREKVFKQLYQVYGQFQHTLAQTLSTHVRTHNFSAQVRKYDSARQAALANNEIPEAVYDTLLERTQAHLPLLHRYVALRKRVLGLKQVHMYDIYTPLTGEPSMKFSYEDAKQTALEALKVLGQDYVDQVAKAFDSRWIDVVENQGKRSGAYSSGVYDTDPYILLNWQDNLDNLFTLVHEMGHSMHSYLTRKNQPYQYGDYPIFLAEIASTTNENLLTQYLLENNSDPEIQAYVINHYLDGFKGTVFRQTQFAQFEKWLHEQDAQGNPLTAQAMSDYYGQVNREYYGPEIADDPEIHLEWARIPHFYYNYYVYQYATGFAAATTLSEGILSGDPAKTEAYLTYLKSGSSQAPLATMQAAGVDMTQAAYLDKAFAIFAQRLDQLEKLLSK